MATEPDLHLRLDVALDGGTLTGRVGRDGLPPRPFTGWIALNAAIEHLLAGHGEKHDDPAGPTPGRQG
jgi:hypothetical protein